MQYFRSSMYLVSIRTKFTTCYIAFFFILGSLLRSYSLIFLKNLSAELLNYCCNMFNTIMFSTIKSKQKIHVFSLIKIK